MTKHHTHADTIPWNKGKLISQKPPLKLHEIWSIRIRLEVANRISDLTPFNLTIDSKLRSCDLVKLRVSGIAHGSHILKRAWLCSRKPKAPYNLK